MAGHEHALSIDPGLEAHYAAIGKAAVEAAVAQGAKPNDKGEVDVDVKLKLNVGASHEGLARSGSHVCCICIEKQGRYVCSGDCC